MKLVKIGFGLVIAVVVLMACVSFWVYGSVTTPRQHDKAGQYLVIEKGSTPSQIIGKLADEGVLPGRYATLIYLRLAGDPSKLQAGEYNFDSPITPLQVLKVLEKGEERTVKLTIPEGFTRFDIAKRIVEKFPQDPPMDDKQILMLMEDTTAIRDIAPEARNLEGYMYPSTYSFPRETKPQEMIAAMTTQFKKVWRPEWTEKAHSVGRTPHEIVTLASLIETESGVESERPVVASVIYNRLAKNIPLGIDMTVIYIAKMQNRWDGTVNRSDLDADSPYNTRKYGGIPPGPISSVSESAIKAALEPAQTDYIYYVRNVELNDGSHHFYASAADFEKGKAEYQRWLEKERIEKREAEAANQ
ncbi:MAG TPA: endolytic transglycosylase MltG [Pyrinomonadaceae bacterium]|nr:endolytic transglycosylase MltG [Pyrinomonadaceae bacterium]